MSNRELFLHNNDKDISDIFDWNNFRIGHFIQKNRGKSEQNQDCLFFYGGENYCLFGVADGVGGHAYGKEAAYTIGETLLQYSRVTDNQNLSIIDVIEKANKTIREKYPSGYSTLACCEIFDTEIRSYSTGDSEIQYLNSQGKTFFHSIPHSPVGYAVAGGHLDQAESLDHEERHLVNSVIGDEHLRIEVSSSLQLKRNSTVIIGSDGLFDNLSHHKISEYVSEGSFEEGFQNLVSFCQKRDENWKKDDDVSFLVLRKIK